MPELTLESPTPDPADLANQIEKVRKKIADQTDAAKKAALRARKLTSREN